MSKLIASGKSLAAVIPRDICKRLSWQKGQELFISADPYNRKVTIEGLKE